MTGRPMQRRRAGADALDVGDNTAELPGRRCAGWVPQDCLAYRVRWVRQMAGLSQRAAAKRCGLTCGEWQGLETGRAGRDMPRKLRQISVGLAINGVPVSIDWLACGDIPDTATVLRTAHRRAGG